MVKITILLCAVFGAVAVVGKINDVSADIKELQQKFDVAKGHYEHLDETNLLKSVRAIMKKVFADLAKIDQQSKAYIDNNCNVFVDQVFDTINTVISSNWQCDVGNLKQRYVNIWSMFDRLKSDVKDADSFVKSPRPTCGDETCTAVAVADKDTIDNLYNGVLSSKISALRYLLKSYAVSIDHCQISKFADFTQEAATFLANTNKCMHESA